MVSKIYRFDPELKGSDQLFVETSAWMAKMDKGLSDEDAEALSTWMAADPRNEKQLLAMAQMWDKMDALARLSEVFPHASGAVPQPVPQVISAVCHGRLAQRYLSDWDSRRTPKSTGRRFILEPRVRYNDI